MRASCYKDLLTHAGHEIQCVTYGEGQVNAALECVTCHQVLVDYEKPLWLPDSGWDDHPDHPRSDWDYEVSNGDTTLGYVDWVNHQLEMGRDEKEDNCHVG